jgi:hypothetical protein
MPPQLGISGGRPYPRKLREASAIITPPMLMEKMMMTGAIILGRTWRTRIWRVGVPTALAARK